MNIKKLKEIRTDLNFVRFAFIFLPVKYHDGIEDILQEISVDISNQLAEDIIVYDDKSFLKSPKKIKQVKNLKRSPCKTCHHIRTFNILVDRFNEMVKDYCLIFNIER